MLRFGDRNFASLDDMDDCIIEETNAIVKREDILYLLGDVSCIANKKRYHLTIDKYFDRINCQTVHLILGNHDKGIMVPHKVKSVSQIHNLYHDKRLYVLCHWCMATWEKCHVGSIHLYGHSHSHFESIMNEKFPGRLSMDVGVDNIFKLTGKYRPIAINEIDSLLEINHLNRGNHEVVDQQRH
jgi:calcineurin-like phosphoesterase family protein